MVITIFCILNSAWQLHRFENEEDCKMVLLDVFTTGSKLFEDNTKEASGMITNKIVEANEDYMGI